MLAAWLQPIGAMEAKPCAGGSAAPAALPAALCHLLQQALHVLQWSGEGWVRMPSDGCRCVIGVAAFGSYVTPTHAHAHLLSSLVLDASVPVQAPLSSSCLVLWARVAVALLFRSAAFGALCCVGVGGVT